ncbi:MAG: hypothetical protein ACI94Y_002913 [Maribacter sp.]|jgi:hypothetical protein
MKDMKKKFLICGIILGLATVFFVMELTRGSQQDCSIRKNYTVDHSLTE